MGSVGDCWESSEGELLALDREAIDPAGGSLAPASGSDGRSDEESPATANTENTLRSDGGSASPSEDPTELSGKEAGLAGAITGGGVG